MGILIGAVLLCVLIAVFVAALTIIVLFAGGFYLVVVWIWQVVCSFFS